MAITNQEIHGFRWKAYTNSVDSSPRIVRAPVATGYQAQVAATYNVALSPGDPLQRLSDGSVILCPGTEGTPGIIFGVLHDVKPYWDGTRMQFGSYLPGGTAWGTNEARRSWVGLIPAFGALFEIDVTVPGANDTVGEFIGLIENNADHILTAVVAGVQSKPKINFTSVGTDAEQWRVKDISRSAHMRDYAGANVKVLVTANEGQGEKYSTTGT